MIGVKRLESDQPDTGDRTLRTHLHEDARQCGHVALIVTVGHILVASMDGWMETLEGSRKFKRKFDPTAEMPRALIVPYIWRQATCEVHSLK